MNKRRKLEGNITNICTGFVLPMVGINYNQLPNNFVNSYVTHDYRIVLVFDKTSSYDVKFYTFMERTKQNSKWLLDITDEDDEIVVIFRIPEVWKDDFDKYTKGKYSEFSRIYKEMLVRFFGDKRKKTDYTVTEFDIIYPDDAKRKQVAEWLGVDISMIGEVFQAPDMDMEIYKPIDTLTSDIKQDKQENQDNL